MTKYVAIGRQSGRSMKVYGPFRCFNDALDFAQTRDPVNAVWNVCELTEEEEVSATPRPTPDVRIPDSADQEKDSAP